MNKQTEAQRIASELTVFAVWPDDYTGTLGKAAAELRRLVTENNRLRKAMDRYSEDEMLAQPAAWWNGEYASPVFAFKRDTPGIGIRNPNAAPLYLAPQPAQQKPLTDTQMQHLILMHGISNGTLEDLIRAVEVAHKITGETP